jgi:hypothetical protein
VYLSSILHQDGDPSLEDLTWANRPWLGRQAYSDTKLHDVLLAFAIASGRACFQMPWSQVGCQPRWAVLTCASPKCDPGGNWSDPHLANAISEWFPGRIGRFTATHDNERVAACRDR